MSITPLKAGFMPVTEPNRYEEMEAAGTILRWQLVYYSLNGTVTAIPDAGTQVPCGVSLNYATVGKKVTVCIDNEQYYQTFVTQAPIALKSQIGFHFDILNNAVANVGAPHNATTKLNPTGAQATYTTTFFVQMIEPAPIPGNPYGNGTGVTPVDCAVFVRLPVLSM